MHFAKIKREEEKFLKTIYDLQARINTLLYKISIDENYDDEETRELFRVYKFIDGLAITKEKPGS